MAVGEIAFITNTTYVANSASQTGGGLWAGGHLASIVNALFARNAAGINGAALRLTAGDQVSILHTTIASPTLVTVSAINLDNFANGHVNLANTIVASHTIAISSTNGTVYEDHNLFFNNVANTIGAVSGGHSMIADPKFVDPPHDNYHLQIGSVAIDHGVDAGIYTDLDGNPCPIGPGFDIGAYEYQDIRYLWLPVIRR